MRVKKENAITIKVLVKDSEGTIISDLATATFVKFMVKETKTTPNAEAIITKSIGDGLTIDDPSTGYIKVVLTSVDTNISIGYYVMAIQIEYSPTNIQEINLSEEGSTTDAFEIYQDIIRG